MFRKAAKHLSIMRDILGRWNVLHVLAALVWLFAACGEADDLAGPAQPVCDVLAYTLDPPGLRMCFYACGEGASIDLVGCSFIIEVLTIEDVRAHAEGQDDIQGV